MPVAIPAVQALLDMRADRRTVLDVAARFAALLALPLTPTLAGCDDAEDETPADPSAKKAAEPSQPAAEPPGPAEPRFFTAAEMAILAAAVDRLLPAAGTLPGAAAAGVAAYVDQQLASPVFAGLQRMMRAGVGFIDRTAKRDHGTGFGALSAAAQSEVLGAFQAGRVGGLRFPQARFFQQLLTFALEGYLGAPRHGGNRDAMVWAALGIDPRCEHDMYSRCDVGGGRP